MPERTRSRILKEKEARTYYNRLDLGLDPRGKKRALLRSETATITNYLDDKSIILDDKGKPWLNITKDTRVDLLETIYFKTI